LGSQRKIAIATGQMELYIIRSINLGDGE